MDTKKILIVDDEKDVLHVLSKRLEAIGQTVIVAKTGHEGIASATSNLPDLIILDMALPDMLGGEVAVALKNNSETREIPIIFLSAMFSKSEEATRGHEIGGHLMFAKPYDSEELLASITNLLGIRQQDKEIPTRIMEKAIKILLVDDEEDIRRTISIRLRKQGYQCILATDGMSAVNSAINESPDLILLDLGLPAGDGFSVMRRITSNPRTSIIPIIVITARDPEENKTLAIEAGAAAFFQKSSNMNDLLATIQSVLTENAINQ